jgi:translocation and assembly module TamB
MQSNSLIRQLLKFISIGLIAIFIILLLLAGTETGSRWLIQTVISNVKQICVAEINGSLASELTLSQLHYQESDSFSVFINELKLGWHATELIQGHLHISLLQLDGIEIKGQPVASDDRKDSHEIPKIPLSVSIDELIINQFDWPGGENKTEIEQLLLTAELKQNTLKLSRVTLAMPQLRVDAVSEIQLQSDWPLTADLDWSYTLDKSTLNGLLKISGNMEQFDFNSVIKGSVESEQKGFIKLSAGQPEFNLNGHWGKLQWPLSGESQVSSNRGDFQIQGTAENYRATLNGNATGKDTADFSIDFIGNGNLKGIDIEHLQLKPTQGLLSLNGHLSWAKGVAFNLALISKQLNPADFGTDIPGKLDLNTHSKGKVEDSKINAQLDIIKMAGTLHGQPFKAHGKVKLADKQVNIQQLQIAAGNNLLKATGQLTNQLADLDLTIVAPDLQTAWPSLAGKLNGNVQIRGSLLKPIITANLKGHKLRYENYIIAKLSLQTDYAHASQKKSKLDFSARDIQIAENKIKRIILKGHGNQSSHNVRFKMISPLANVSINTDGQWDEKKWSGQINQLILDHPQLKKWQLQSVANVTLSKTKESFVIDLPNSCLFQNKARLCFSAQETANKDLDGTISLSAWPLALTKPWLPETLALQGLVSAQTQFSSSSKDLTADVSAKVTEALALLKDEQNVTHKLSFTDSALQLQYQHDRLNANIHLGLGKQDYITAEIVADPAGKTGIRQLSGTLKSNISDMTFFDGLLTRINQLKGQFIANLKVTGDTRQPIVTGSAKLQNGQFKIPKLGTDFRKLNVLIDSASGNSERLQLNARIESGEGQLSAKGHLDLLAEHNFPLHMAITGEQFQVSRLPEAEVIISPHLTIDKQDNLTKIDGLIKIDKAQIEIKSLPETAIAPSEDEIIITLDKSKPKKIDLSRLNTHITIQFGDNSHFSGFGLKTRLAGKLEYVAKRDKQRMQGRAVMKDATYRSYGQDLTIRKGEFLFNGPADNPWLNIEAIRKATSEDVTAVLNVTGPLKNPKTRVFTEPALPESEALAYLVTGSSLKNMGESGSGTVASAAFNYGAGHLSWLSDQLGIDDFEFKEGETIEDSAVRLGHYLTPDLYIGVTMGLFSNKYAADLRYRLSEHFSINTRAGETQRINLKYHVEVE